MFEKIYKTKNLAVARLAVKGNVECFGDNLFNAGLTTEYKRTNEYVIVRAFTKFLDTHNSYEDIFTKLELYTRDYMVSYGENFIVHLFPINDYLTDNELLTGKITKSRLIEIYRMLNKREDEYDDNYENYQDGTNGKVIKFARKCNKK